MRSVKRKLIKFSGYSLALVLPKKVLKQFGWRGADTVSVAIDGRKKRLIVSKSSALQSSKKNARAKKPLSDEDDFTVKPIPEL